MKIPSCISSVSFLVLLLFASTAQAHPIDAFHDDHLIAGLRHPFLGIDHLLAMAAVGIWAGQLGGRATWQAPATFVAMLFAAASIGAFGVSIPMVGATLASSVLLLGLIVGTTLRLPTSAVCGIVAWFAFCHGYVHGQEMSHVPSPMLYEAGFLLATVLLLVLGIAVGYYKQWRYYVPIQRLAGASLMTGSVILLMS